MGFGKLRLLDMKLSGTGFDGFKCLVFVASELRGCTVEELERLYGKPSTLNP